MGDRCAFFYGAFASLSILTISTDALSLRYPGMSITPKMERVLTLHFKMAPQVLYRVCYGTPRPSALQKSLLTIRPAILHSYCRHKVRDCDYPAIVPSPGASVRGTYVQGLTDADVWRLNIFEGDQYTREKVQIKLLEQGSDTVNDQGEDGPELEAETYVWASGEEDLEQEEWDFVEFRSQKISRWIGGNEEYEEVDEAVRAAGKDPTGGRGLNGGIAEQLETLKTDQALKSAV